MPRLILPSNAFDDVSALLRLDEEQFRALIELFGKPASIVPNADFMQEVATRLHLDTSTAESIVLVCQFLLTVAEDGDPRAEILKDLREFVVRNAPSDKDGMVSAFDGKRGQLESLLAPKPERSKALKIRYLTHGLYPTVDSFRTVCELRPVFESARDQETIIGLVPVIVMEIQSSDIEGEDQKLLLHFTPDMLRSLKDTIVRTEEKLAAIQARFGKDLLAKK